jgi:hypothetical protein
MATNSKPTVIKNKVSGQKHPSDKSLVSVSFPTMLSCISNMHHQKHITEAYASSEATQVQSQIQIIEILRSHFSKERHKSLILSHSFSHK